MFDLFINRLLFAYFNRVIKYGLLNRIRVLLSTKTLEVLSYDIIDTRRYVLYLYIVIK